MTDERSPASELFVPNNSIAWLWNYTTAQWNRLFGLNVSRLDDLLYVGGEFRANQWPHLRTIGIRAVLSLQAEREDVFEGPPPDRVLRLEVVDFYPPTIEQLRQAVAFVSAAHADGLPTLIHCHAGVGRAPLTTAAYLVAQGMTSTEALAQVRRARPIIGLNERQMRRLTEWEQVVRG